MKTEDFLSDDFLKQFKTADQLNNFLAQIQKRGIEKMLEGELDSHLGYDKHDPMKATIAVMDTVKRRLRPAMVNLK
ncbi:MULTISPECIES: hypothetical protein [Chitinophaga]|uniref:hypothetical protein n=1 Tax=Chitinophaga sp. Ak27 TaxID=2726116 RepID=UPI001FFD3DAA|nr:MULTISPECIES: hypothetical protein [Chitinophaga]